MEQTYQDLMSQLRTIHARIAGARKAYDDARKASKDAERAVDNEKAEILISCGGYKGLGSNDDNRKQALAELLANSIRYQSACIAQRNADYREMDAKRSTDDLKTEFDSITAQVNLHRDFLKYSALAAAKPEAASLLEL